MLAGKKTVSLIMIFVFFALSSCATQQQNQGAGIGGAVGGVAGAMLDSRNPWRGGVIGAVLGGIFGATIADISSKAAVESAHTGRPVSTGLKMAAVFTAPNQLTEVMSGQNAERCAKGYGKTTAW